jgi:hypothetical protein
MHAFASGLEGFVQVAQLLLMEMVVVLKVALVVAFGANEIMFRS